MFPSGVSNTTAAEDTSESTPQRDRELLSLVMQGMPRSAHRLWRLHPEIFENNGSRAELPPGWEEDSEYLFERLKNNPAYYPGSTTKKN